MMSSAMPSPKCACSGALPPSVVKGRTAMEGSSGAKTSGARPPEAAPTSETGAMKR